MEYKENSPKQVIIIRKDLNMRKGKMVAQGAHASMKVIFDMMVREETIRNTGDVPFGMVEYRVRVLKNSSLEKWISGIFKKIVVGSENLNEMVEAYNEAKKQGIPCSLIEDAGLTEFGGNITITAVAIGPDTPERIDPITSKFKLL